MKEEEVQGRENLEVLRKIKGKQRRRISQQDSKRDLRGIESYLGIGLVLNLGIRSSCPKQKEGNFILVPF